MSKILKRNLQRVIKTLPSTNLQINQCAKQTFNLDTYLLGHFVKPPAKAKKMIEFGSGDGVLMLLLSQKTRAKIIGLEIQEVRHLRAVENIKMNQLEHQLESIHIDIKQFTYKDADCIIVNPPFFKVDHQVFLSPNEERSIARHELKINLSEIIESASRMLKYGGTFYMIHRPERLNEIFELFDKFKLAIKKIRFVHPYQHKNANHVLLQALKYGEAGLVVQEPLIIYETDGRPGKEIREIYGGDFDVVKFAKSQRKT
jgi:tRNA1(Val) A37 N6-methylase TrmN6